MMIGVPKEIMDGEYRVSQTPAGVRVLSLEGHRVMVEHNAGEGSGFPDEEYAKAGAEVLATAAEVFNRSDMILKVKEPLAEEYEFLREGLIVFTYLHLAGSPSLARTLLDRRVTAIAYETVERSDGRLPLLAPMSEIAGRMAVQAGAHCLERPSGGAGKLLGGATGVRPCKVVVVGAGVVGSNAATLAVNMGAKVTVLDISLDALRRLNDLLGGRLDTLVSNPVNLADAVKDADLVIGAALVPGARCPQVVTREMVKTMKQGSVIVDVSVDQGGCVETCRPTTHTNPTYTVDGVIHYCVANIPGAVPHTSTSALSSATLPYIVELANLGLAGAVAVDPSLAIGVNVHAGHVTHPTVAESLRLLYVPLNHLLD